MRFPHCSYYEPKLKSGPFVGLLGSEPGSTVSLAKQISVLLALSATIHRAWTEETPEVVWEGAGTRFPHPRDVLMRVLEVHDPNSRVALLRATFYSSQPTHAFVNIVLF